MLHQHVPAGYLCERTTWQACKTCDKAKRSHSCACDHEETTRQEFIRSVRELLLDRMGKGEMVEAATLRA
jgi:hypothetical protein